MGYRRGGAVTPSAPNPYASDVRGRSSSVNTKLAMPVLPHDPRAWSTPRDEYVGPFPKADDESWDDFYARGGRELADAANKRKHDWDRSIRHGIATGRITSEQAHDLGYHHQGYETNGDWGEEKRGRWRPLPSPLYHVTTNLPAIQNTGRLYAPDELDLGGRGRGLGGGSQDTISFTTDPHLAEELRQRFHEASDVASGRTSIHDLIENARTGSDAKQPYLDKFTPNGGAMHHELADLLNGRKRFSPYDLPEDHPLKDTKNLPIMGMTAEQWAEHGYYPDEHAREYTGTADGIPRYSYPWTPVTPEEQNRRVFDWWRTSYLNQRQGAGGPENPVFTSVDPEWFANLDPNHIGIVQAEPVPGGHGYPMSSLAEWRTPTGAAVNITHLNGQPYPGQRMAKVVTSDKLHDFLMNPKSRPDLQTPEGQAWLQHLDRAHGYGDGKLDPLTPWLTREWKKGRLRPEEGRLGAMSYQTPDGGIHRIDTRHLGHWVDFLNSNHPIRRQLGDIMQHKVGDFHDAVEKWDEAMKEEAQAKSLSGGQVVHTTPDGWTVRKLTTPEELKGEGDVMGHCVGGYGNAVRDGKSLIYSLRDPKGFPHVTTEIRPTRFGPPEIQRYLDTYFRGDPIAAANSWKVEPERLAALGSGAEPQTPSEWNLWHALRDSSFSGRPVPHNGQIVQIQGKGNKIPIPDYQARLKDWFTSFSESERPNWEEPEPITHVRDLNPEHPDNRDYGGYGYDQDSGYTPHGDYGLATRMPPIDYDSIVPTIVRHPYQGYRDPEPYDQSDIDALYEAAAARGELPQLSKAHENWNDNEVNSHVNDVLDQNFDQLDYPGEDWEEDPDRWQRIADTIGGTPEEAHEAALEAYHSDEAELMQQSGLYQASNALGEKLAPFNEQQFRQQSQSPPQTFSHVRIAALYKRWAFDPATGQTRVSDNDGDPLDVAYHTDLAKTINRPDTLHGYAYALPDGWRIVDQDSKPVTDPFVMSSIMRALSP